MGSNVTGQYPVPRVRGVISTSRRTKEVTVLRPGYAQKIVGRKPADEIVRAFLQSEAANRVLLVNLTLDGDLIIQMRLDSIVPGNGQHDFVGMIPNGDTLVLIQGKFFGERGGEFTVLDLQP